MTVRSSSTQSKMGLPAENGIFPSFTAPEVGVTQKFALRARYFKLIVVVAAVMSHLFCRLEKVLLEAVRCREKDTPPVLNQMEFSG